VAVEFSLDEAFVKHRLENTTREPLELVEVQCGSYLGEDDIVRFDDIYGRAGGNR
jgi:mannose-1-phosphate guanylyltransferase/mannose-6-phosphate isomerase